MADPPIIAPETLECADFALLRTPAYPRSEADRTLVDIVPGRSDERALLTGLITRLVADQRLMEAVAFSSPPLFQEARAIASGGGGERKLSTIRRVTYSLSSYLLRMSTRATPFGLLAGATVAHFGSRPKAEYRANDRKHPQVDLAWLRDVLTGLRDDPRVLAGLPVQANKAVRFKGGRIILPYLPPAASDDPADHKTGSLSLRLTPVTAEIVSQAAAEVKSTTLVQRVAENLGVQPKIVLAVVRQLIGNEILLTGLQPSLVAADVLGEALGRLEHVPDHPVVRSLRQLHDALVRYADEPDEKRLALLQRMIEQAGELSPAAHKLRVDLEIDADVTLPSIVATELAEAVRVLCRVMPVYIGVPALRGFHLAFLERYGTDRLVPVKDLLDPDIGLGAPAEYQCPPSSRDDPAFTPDTATRDQVVAEMVADAIRTGAREVELTDELVERLASPESGALPASLDFYAHLVAPSLEAMSTGDFRLVASPAPGAQRGGTSFGRFLHMLGTQAGPVMEFGREVPLGNGAPLPADLVYHTRFPRALNVVQAPPRFDHRITLGEIDANGPVEEVDLDDLEVGADMKGLFLYSRRRRRRVVPSANHVLNPDRQAANLARFLSDVGYEGTRVWTAWNWGELDRFPFLPRLRYRRTVLYPATWRINDPRITDSSEHFDIWRQALLEWRKNWGVPDRVQLWSIGDHRIVLDLTNAFHLQILRREIGRSSELVVREVLAGEDYPDGWLTGPGGGYVCELVVPMVNTTMKRRERARRTGPLPSQNAAPPRWERALSHLPGSDWLCANIYCSPEAQSALVAGPLKKICHTVSSRGWADRWFFLRYRDRADHVRLRFHGARETVTGPLLSQFHEWMADLHADGQIGWLSLESYEPEIERYGGVRAMKAAEEYFTADSELAMNFAALLRGRALPLDETLLCAIGIADLVTRFRQSLEQSAPLAQDPEYRRAFTDRRREAVKLIDPVAKWTGLRATPEGEHVVALLRARSSALCCYATTIRELTAAGQCSNSPEKILDSLVHMFCNRVMGIGQDRERRAVAVALGALQANLDKRRFMG
ncbi:lantibiotic dehydratase [Actinomadura terrae]|uniref:lantibiotic dehydratase n=1 Tax=Actinomadura terrae TaxID=604353 RepID=UPI001FA6F85A|nr:lantibiotic dehydratase [Actinomadura terrae]